MTSGYVESQSVQGRVDGSSGTNNQIITREVGPVSPAVKDGWQKIQYKGKKGRNAASQSVASVVPVAAPVIVPLRNRFKLSSDPSGEMLKVPVCTDESDRGAPLCEPAESDRMQFLRQANQGNMVYMSEGTGALVTPSMSKGGSGVQSAGISKIGPQQGPAAFVVTSEEGQDDTSGDVRKTGLNISLGRDPSLDILPSYGHSSERIEDRILGVQVNKLHARFPSEGPCFFFEAIRTGHTVKPLKVWGGR